VTFDETNGSQVEQVNPNLVEEEEPPFQAIKKMAIGEVRPREAQAQEQDEPSSSTRVEPPSIPLDQGQSQDHGDDHDHEQDQEIHEDGETHEPQGQNNDGDDEEPIQRQSQVTHPRVHQSVQRDHPVDNILGSIQRGVTTRSRLQNFCGFYSFVSSLEPLRVEEALEDLDWVLAM